MITVDDLVVKYGQVVAVDSVDLSAAQGQTIGLVGPNGSGKSSVLRSILGALERARGDIAIDGDNVDKLKSHEISRRMAVVAQEEPTGLPMTAWDSVLLGRSVHVSGWSNYRQRDRDVAQQAMRHTGVWHMADRQVEELSGGERQRVLIARALAQEATHLLLDEPTNHLDVRYQHEVLSLVAGLPLCTIVVLHDLNLAARYCDEVVLLDTGKVVAAGRPSDVLQPQVLEPVYGINIKRLDLDGVPQLLFALSESPVERRVAFAAELMLPVDGDAG